MEYHANGNVLPFGVIKKNNNHHHNSLFGDTRETSHLYQRVSVLVQRFNAVLLLDSLPVLDCTD